jgi:hypothetical protein
LRGEARLVAPSGARRERCFAATILITMRIQHNREHRVRCALGRADTDHERVVVVVDQLDSARQASAHFRERRARHGADLGRVFVDESGELRLLLRTHVYRPDQ